MELRDVMRRLSPSVIAVEIIGEEPDTPEARERLLNLTVEPPDLLPGLWKEWQTLTAEERRQAIADGFAGLAGWPDDPE